MFKKSSGSFVVPLRRLWLACGLCVALTMPAIGQSSEEEPDVSVSEYGTVDLAVQDTDLAQVLQMLAIQSKKNIIASKSVSATVTANLFDVTFKEALDSILRVNGYGYREEGNFIYVYTLDELQAIQNAQRTTESRIFELEYLAASDAQEFITPLLSDVGQSAYLGDVPTGFKPDIGDGGADSYAYAAKLVVNDYAENLESIAALLSEVDTPPEQVLIEATILQTLLDEANAWGVDFNIIADMDFTDLTNPLSAVNDLLRGEAEDGFQPEDNRATGVQSTVGNTAGPAGLKIGVVSNDVSVFVRILDEVADTTVLARPKIMALNRQRAEVLVGARVGYLSTTATETTTTQSVEFLDTGIQLVFRPFISPDGMIRMELAPSVSEASLRTVTDANGLIVTIPDELTNELTTNVRIRDGETLVLGGLFRESTRVGRRQIPFLGDVPLLGIPFRGQDDTAERDEIIFLITPSIVKDEVLWEMGEDSLAMVDTIRVGARNGLLIFSRERRISNYNRDAIDAYGRGDTEMALYYANQSLRLNDAQPQILKLHQTITGDRERAYEHSIMERITRESMGSLLADEPQAYQRMSVPPASVWREHNNTDNNNNTNSNTSQNNEPSAQVETSDDDAWFNEPVSSATEEFGQPTDDALASEWSDDEFDADDSWEGNGFTEEADVDTDVDWTPSDVSANADTEPQASSEWESEWDSATTDFEASVESNDWNMSSSDDDWATTPSTETNTWTSTPTTDSNELAVSTNDDGWAASSVNGFQPFARAEDDRNAIESGQAIPMIGESTMSSNTTAIDSYENESFSNADDYEMSEPVSFNSNSYDRFDETTIVSNANSGVVSVGHREYFTRYFRRSIFGFWLPAVTPFDDVAGVSGFGVETVH